MNRTKNILCIAFSLLLCLSLVLSFADTNDLPAKSDFSHDAIRSHVGHMCEAGPHSILDKEENKQVQEYIIAQLESLGIVNADTTESPAYLVQSYVTESKWYQGFYLDHIIVHIPANAPEQTHQAVMTMAHFDSVSTGSGASDDAVSCGTMLEAIRHYLDRMQDGETFTNDLVFCFVNGEEFDLLGSEAFMEEFTGFDDLTKRIRFAINLESRGTAGTQIMFETAEQNYNTVKLFSEVNDQLFTCSIATMIYGMMPNSTDFSNYKEFYQGVNMANVGQGENYHTQNDDPAHLGENYLAQQARIVNRLLDKLGSYDLDSLYAAEENAIFFSYLNIGEVVYHHAVSIVLAVIGITLLAANVILSMKNKRKNLLGTLKGLLTILIGLALTAGTTFGCCYLFQLIAAVSGNIDFHLIGRISYTNMPISIGIAILALGVTALTAHFGCRLFRMQAGDIRRAFAYLHAFLGIVLTFVLPDASYLFIFSGLMLMLNEIAVSIKPDLEHCHFELLAEALYMPVAIPIITIAASALGLNMAYVFALLYALAMFGIACSIAPVCGCFSVNALIRKDRSRPVSGWVGALHIIGVSFVMFLCVSLTPYSIHSDLGGGFSYTDDDALIYSTDGENFFYYCVYDLSAYKALQKYCPEMEFNKDDYGYMTEAEKLNLGIAPQSTADGNTLHIKHASENSMIYLTLMEADAKSYTVDDGTTVQTFEIRKSGYASIMLHGDCTVTLNGGSAFANVTEYIVDYPQLIPENYDPEEQLHFNLWLWKEFELT
ncbi:MAG: M28 family peptidase [Oscillospiraceae bacterium]|nr:M28 family peptidase [Oscillospiraceae bacterium]